jgi:hypothetical protein
MLDKFNTWMKKTETKLAESKLIKWGFCQNYWGWSHAMMGGIFAKILLYLALWIWAPIIIAILWVPAMIIVRLAILLAIFIGASIWEKIEEKMEAPTDDGKKDIYGSVERWKYDGKGDIWLAVITAFIAII